MMNPITMTVSDVVKNADLSYHTRLHAASIALIWLCDNTEGMPRGPYRGLSPSLYVWRIGRHVPHPDPRRELVFVLEAIHGFNALLEAVWVHCYCPADMRVMLGSADLLAKDLADQLEDAQ